jgi:hypothetical protein
VTNFLRPPYRHLKISTRSGLFLHRSLDFRDTKRLRS